MDHDAPAGPRWGQPAVNCAFRWREKPFDPQEWEEGWVQGGRGNVEQQDSELGFRGDQSTWNRSGVFSQKWKVQCMHRTYASYKYIYIKFVFIGFIYGFWPWFCSSAAKQALSVLFSVEGLSGSQFSQNVPGLIPNVHSLLVGLLDSKVTTLAASKSAFI